MLPPGSSPCQPDCCAVMHELCQGVGANFALVRIANSANVARFLPEVSALTTRRSTRRAADGTREEEHAEPRSGGGLV
jgi:hypothetical protein